MLKKIMYVFLAYTFFLHRGILSNERIEIISTRRPSGVGKSAVDFNFQFFSSWNLGPEFCGGGGNWTCSSSRCPQFGRLVRLIFEAVEGFWNVARDSLVMGLYM